MVWVSGTPEESVLIFLVVPLDHADADRQQHGGNDGCGEDEAVLKRKQEPVGQHDREDQHAAERFELKAAPTR